MLLFVVPNISKQILTFFRISQVIANIEKIKSFFMGKKYKREQIIPPFISKFISTLIQPNFIFSVNLCLVPVWNGDNSMMILEKGTNLRRSEHNKRNKFRFHLVFFGPNYHRTGYMNLFFLHLL